MLTVEDWAEIRRLYRAEGMPIKAIARHLGIARNTVRAAVRSDGPPKYERKPAGSAVDEFEPRIRELLGQYPAMPATVIAERVGWQRGLTVLKAPRPGACAPDVHRVLDRGKKPQARRIRRGEPACRPGSVPRVSARRRSSI